MHKKITTLLAIVLLSAQITPVFAQSSYGPNGLCTADQMQLCGEQARQYFNKAVNFVKKHENQIFGSPFLTSPLHYTIWRIQRGVKKEQMQQERNKKAIVNTKTYEENAANKSQNKKKPAAQKQAPAKKK